MVVQADGKPVDQVNTLQRIIRAHKPGDVVDIDVMRFGDKKSFKVKLAEVQDTPAVASNNVEDSGAANGVRARPTTNVPSAVRSMDKLGISVEPISSDFAREAKLERGVPFRVARRRRDRQRTGVPHAAGERAHTRAF